jgi:hypothetical protein
MPTALTGGCLCGAIRYTIRQPISELRACRCKNCQKASGAGGSVNAAVPSSAFTLTKGTPKRYSAVADSGRTLHRYFCAECGSPIYSQRATTPEIMMVRAGTLDESSGLKITTNIWTKSACSWDYIDPASKQFPAQPDAPPTPA